MAGALLQTAALAAFNAGAPLAVANVLASATTAFVVNAAITTAASYALSAATRPAVQKPSDGQVEVKQPLPPLRVIYGRRKVGVNLGFAGRSDEAFPHYGRTCLIAGHEIDAFEAHYLYGLPAEVDDDGTVINLFGPLGGNHFAQIGVHLGTPDQAADEFLLLWFPGTWTEEHRGRGIAYASLVLGNPGSPEDIQKIFPQGPPEYQALVRGKKLYDPTLDTTNGGSGSCRMDDSSTWVWSEEQRLIKLDFLTQPMGHGLGFDVIDWATWYPQILRGRELVPKKDGGAEKRYRASLEYYPALADPADIFPTIAAAGDSRIFFTRDEKIGCRGGAWDEPTVSLSVADAGIEAEFGRPDVMDSYNVLKFKFLSTAHEYVEQPGDPWRNEASIAENGELEKEVDLTAVPDHGQARRLCKIMMARDNPKWIGQATTKLHGLEAIGEDAIDLSFAEFDDGSGDFDGPFWVSGEISADLDSETILLPARSADPTSYDWDAETEEGVAPRDPGALPATPAFLSDDEAEQVQDDEIELLIDEAA